jgi:hypothetical protein
MKLIHLNSLHMNPVHKYRNNHDLFYKFFLHPTICYLHDKYTSTKIQSYIRAANGLSFQHALHRDYIEHKIPNIAHFSLLKKIKQREL